MDLLDPEKALNLDNIRFTLIRQEDTIIFNLIERAQFPVNETIYKPKGVQPGQFQGSFLDWLLRESEAIHAKIRRYESPDEYPFSHDLPKPILPPLRYPCLIKGEKNEVNVNEKLKDSYIRFMVPAICPHDVDKGEREENYGSAAVCDVNCLQSLSRRIHYGKFVAEVKFLSQTERFTKMIGDNDVEAIEAAITDSVVERKVLERLHAKALAYGRDPQAKDGPSATSKVAASAVVNIYKDWVIPLTKQVEVEYLLGRLDHS